jgi:Flp pilus assembly protein TadG
MQRLKSLICDEDASELVEFSVSAAIFFTLMLGVIEICIAAYASSFVSYAAQKGTRYAMVRGSDWSAACTTASSYGCYVEQANGNLLQNYILSLPHPGLNFTSSNSNITVTWPGTAAGASATCTSTAPYAQGCQVQVTVSYTYQVRLPIYSIPIHLTSTSTETIQD